MNSILMRKVVVGAAYAPLVLSRTAFSGVVSCPPANAAVVNFLGDDGSDVPWIAGEWHEFKDVDLSGIQVKGAVGDTVTVVGGDW